LTARPFSVADVIGDRFGMGYIVVGRGTKLLSRMEPDTEVSLVGPLGRPFHYLEPAATHVMIAGGIGSAPFPLLARALEAEQPDAARIVLLGGRTREHLYLKDRFLELGCDFRAATDDGSEGHHGFVTDLLEPFLGASDTRLYACGPTPMFQAIDRRLEGCDTPCEISVEPLMACGFGACYGCVVPVRDGDDWTYVKSCQEGPTFEIRDLLVDRMEAH
jgi:dihydroorotate dehydrogenase electron transfer subunit